jgi:predicted amidohydrolase
MCLLGLFFLLCSVGSVLGLGVGVLEYNPLLPPLNASREEAIATMMENARRMESLASLGTVDLIVFPEDSLYGVNFPTPESIRPFLEVVPFPFHGSPCEMLRDVSPVLAFLSCMAQKRGIYVVAVMGEVDSVSSRQYNTAVAFNRNGSLVARYRKSHLYFEPQFDEAEPVASLFEVDGFGLVGLGICFDSMFPQPIRALKELGVQLIALPSWWVNNPPLQIGPAMHQAIARFHGVPIVTASSGHNWFNSGSGCYTSSGVQNMFYNPSFSGHSKLVLCNISASSPLKNGFLSTRTLDRPVMKPVPSFSSTSFVASPFLEGSIQAGPSCQASYSFGAKVHVNETYGLVSFRGPYSPQGNATLFNARICAVVRCTILEGCGSVYFSGEPTLSSSVFASLSVRCDDCESSNGNGAGMSLAWVLDGALRVLQPKISWPNVSLQSPSTISSVAMWKVLD